METYGVDVAKAELVVCGEAGTLSLENGEAAARAWLSGLPAGAELAVEATGRYHRPLLRLAKEAGVRVYLVDGQSLAAYRRAVRPRSKTDAGDAEVLRRYLLAERASLRAAEHDAGAEALGDLQRLREGLVAQRTALRQRRSAGGWVPPSLEGALQGLDDSIRELDEEIRRRASASPLYARLLEVDGVGPATAAALVWMLGSRDFASADKAVAFAGLDVRVSQSGTFRGKGRLTKRGPGMLRRLLFLAARSLCRSEPWKPVFERHRAKGLSHTAASVAVARKLLRVAWGLAAHPGRVYDRAKTLGTA